MNTQTPARPLSRRLQQFDFDRIEFGYTATDHMLVAHYKEGAWQPYRIEPFADLQLSPLSLCFHYGQTVFEGLKAYRLQTGQISLFRLRKHFERMNRSLQRMCMPVMPASLFEEGIRTLVEADGDWVSDKPGKSLYLRPLVLATEARLGVRPSSEYLFVVMALPMGDYYPGNIRVKVETRFVRAVEGGAGDAKNGGNYGAVFLPSVLAKVEGFDQVLWTDGKENRYIEESGMMNILFLIDGVLVTPPLTGTILDGVTRDSLLTLAREEGIPVEERRISYQELEQAFREGRRVEAFGAGTAAVITPIEAIDILGSLYHPDVSASALHHRLKDRLTRIRTGLEEDRWGWNELL